LAVLEHIVAEGGARKISMSDDIGRFGAYRWCAVLMVLGKFIETIGVVSLMVDTGLAKTYR
jgi:hypothetical protein